MKITQFCYIQADRTNQPVKSGIFSDGMSVIDALNLGWPSHAPFEQYHGWGTKDTWIGSLNHTFKVEGIDHVQVFFPPGWSWQAVYNYLAKRGLGNGWWYAEQHQVCWVCDNIHPAPGNW